MTRSFALCVLLCAIITRDDVPDAEYRALGERPEFASVVRVVPEAQATASGVLIAPRWIITAAHVVVAQPSERFVVVVGGTSIPVLRAIVHPEYLRRAGPERNAYDQALLELERDAPATPARRAQTLPDSGVRATLVGFGIGGPAAQDPSGTLRAAHNRIDQFGGTQLGRDWPPHVMFLDFDVPGRASFNTLGGDVPEPLEGVASGGDSGGGMFVEREGRWELVGTFSSSSIRLTNAISGNFAGMLNLYVGVAAAGQWIDGIITDEASP